MVDLSLLNSADDILEGLEVDARLDQQDGAEKIIIKLKGILTPVNTGEFTGRVLDFFYGDWKEIPIILDLRDLLYISSGGIGALTTLRMQADHKKSPLYLFGMNEKVKSVFDLLGFTSFFQLTDSIQDIP